MSIRGLTAFSLIEMIGVLAVLALVAAALAPVAIRRIDQAAWNKEVTDLGTVSNALAVQVIRNRYIPSDTDWAAVTANWIDRSTSQIATNSRGFARLFFYDSGSWLGGASPSTITLPYSQTSGGTSAASSTGTLNPVGSRLLVVSTMAKALPDVHGALATSDFNSIWNAGRGTIPKFLTDAPQSWTGKADDLVIQRINLDPAFHRLLLVTRDNSTAAGYSINSTTNYSAVPNAPSGWDSYYLDGTAVGLWVGTNQMNRFLLTRDISFTFDQGMWQAGLTGASQDNSAVATNFAYQASRFIGTDNVPTAHGGATAQGLLSALYSFMYSYTIWANGCPHFQFNASSPQQQTDYKMLDALGSGNTNGVGNSGIIGGTVGKGGLLK